MALDMFAYMLGKGQGGSGGSGSGGGSGDLSLANVTFQNNTDDGIVSYLPYVITDDDNPAQRPTMMLYEVDVDLNSEATIQVPLYNGAFCCKPYTLVDNSAAYAIDYVGDIDQYKNWIVITGDCTISVSYNGSGEQQT